jgi:hypothetical protein
MRAAVFDKRFEAEPARYPNPPSGSSVIPNGQVTWIMNTAIDYGSMNHRNSWSWDYFGAKGSVRGPQLLPVEILAFKPSAAKKFHGPLLI